MPNITKNIVGVELLLHYEYEMSANIGIVNIKYKVTRMRFIRLEKYGLYYLHVSHIQHNQE